jgi:CIC family chloride channel protein
MIYIIFLHQFFKQYMKNKDRATPGIPVSPTLQTYLNGEATSLPVTSGSGRGRILTISILSILIAVGVSLVAKLLVYLIYVITNLSYYGHLSISNNSPAHGTLGPWMIFMPAIGGLIVGFMALYGSKAIRGHGIPEAMEQILTNQSRIPPAITYLKPLSSAIAIGTGGPFGAEGPIIATGGALGSTIGQMLRITDNERKILLTAGSTAGMAAIFGSPVAAIFLGIELLLFEFSPRSIIPVALACITGAAGHQIFFGSQPVFLMNTHSGNLSNSALATYSILGMVIGLFSVATTKIVYWIEDHFEKIPVHWMWWPAIGGVAVGIIGYFYPHTLGVGYDNITAILSGKLTLSFLLGLCFFKFVSWSVSLGSGTSGGTLAPLFIIGGAAGAFLGGKILQYFPFSGVSLPLCALVGMSAMFAGASRAFLTSIIFAIETTGQTHALLPLLGACGGSYIVSFFLMKNTIMTEKISRRGIKTPDSYEPDFLEEATARQVMEPCEKIVREHQTLGEVVELLKAETSENPDHLLVTDKKGNFSGLLKTSTLYSHMHQPGNLAGSLASGSNAFITADTSLRHAVEKMAAENVEAIAVWDPQQQYIIGILSFSNIMTAYRQKINAHKQSQPVFSLKEQGLKVKLKGQKILGSLKMRNS